MSTIKPFIPPEHIRRTLISRKQSIIRLPMHIQPDWEPNTNSWTLNVPDVGAITWPDRIKPIYVTDSKSSLNHIAPYHADDILYLPEPWRRAYLYIDQHDCKKVRSDKIYDGIHYETDKQTYYPNDPRPIDPAFYAWQELIVNKPHVKSADSMPANLARHFLRVKNIRIERVQRIDFDDMCFDVLGLTPNEWNDAMVNGTSPTGLYAYHWDDFMLSEYITKLYGDKASSKYDWQTNPWIWCIEVEQIHTALGQAHIQRMADMQPDTACNIERKGAENATKQERMETPD